jgi:TRAP-type C4-dicarboxylate transport system substrate-binding protein
MKTLLTVIGVTALIVTAPGAPVKAATELTLVYPFPDFLIYTKQCKQLAERITKAGIKVKVLPFNSIKMFQQPTAARKGRVDLVCTPAAFYARAIPENEAISTSNVGPATVRANGGTGMIDRLNQKHFNVKYLGWTGAGGRFRIYMKNAPKFRSGMLDLSGVKLRDNPIYGAFFKAMQGSTHPMGATQVYAALEKGVVNASAWATIGLKGLKWDKFLRHAVEPEFYQTDIGWIMNLDRWKKLSAADKKTLQGELVAAEMRHEKTLKGLATTERATLVKEGMIFHKVPNKAAYSKLAVDSAYKRMMARLEKAKRPTDHVSKLRTLYQQ